MSVKINGHTIASKLRKMFSSNGQTVATNLDGEMPSGSGSGNVVVLEMEEYDNGYRVKNNTWQEIYDFLQAGTIVFLTIPWPTEDPSMDYSSNEILRVTFAYYTNSQYISNHYSVEIANEAFSGNSQTLSSLSCAAASDHPYWVPD